MTTTMRSKPANRVAVGEQVQDGDGDWQTVTAIRRGMYSEVCLSYANGREEWMHRSSRVDLRSPTDQPEEKPK